MSNNTISPMLQAFLNQTNISNQSDQETDNRLEQENLIQKEIERKALLQLSISQNIKDYMLIGSELKESDINQKPEVHKNFKNYDHSLEKVRIKFESKEDSNDVGSVEEMFNSIFKD